MMNALKPILFQFTPLREGRHVSDEGVRVHFYFNSRPSARGDGNPAEREGTHMISIHAPPRGATHRICPWLAKKLISIHAPPRGATNRRDARPAVPTFQFTPLREGRHARLARHQRLFRHFNSRPSARGDASARNVPRKPLISIHAPPRGATTAKPQGLGAFQFQFTPLREGRRVSFASRKPVSPNFNSRPSARGDPIPAHGDSTFPFQFTPLREGRPNAFSTLSVLVYFNSRPSARGDKSSIVPLKHPQISIHAPPRGATYARDVIVRLKLISIHAPPRGATVHRPS